MSDDAALVDASLAGDDAAFSTLVERHRDVAVRVASRIAGADEAEDVAQDAFLRAYTRLDRYRGDGTFRAWLLQIVHNAALNETARKRPEPMAEPEPAGARAAGLGDRAVRTPAQELEASERLRRLEQKLRLLPADHRLVLVLRDVEGLSYGEVADAAAVPLGTVKGRLHRARGELIDLLRRNTYDWELPDEPA